MHPTAGFRIIKPLEFWSQPLAMISPLYLLRSHFGSKINDFAGHPVNGGVDP